MIYILFMALCIVSTLLGFAYVVFLWRRHRNRKKQCPGRMLQRWRENQIEPVSVYKLASHLAIYPLELELIEEGSIVQVHPGVGKNLLLLGCPKWLVARLEVELFDYLNEDEEEWWQ